MSAQLNPCKQTTCLRGKQTSVCGILWCRSGGRWRWRGYGAIRLMSVTLQWIRPVHTPLLVLF